ATASSDRRLAVVASYEGAGVSLATAGAVVERLRVAVESTGADGFGAFAGLYPLGDDRFLAASLDSIGTKPIVARARGALRSCGMDFAACCVGIVARADVIDGSRVEAGDLVVGFPSVGVHANGFSLVRRVLEAEDYDGDDLLAPTRLYLEDVRALRLDADVRALAHVTGGGIEGNVSRVVPDGLRVRIDWDAWERPAVFEWLGRHVDEDELRRVF